MTSEEMITQLSALNAGMMTQYENAIDLLKSWAIGIDPSCDTVNECIKTFNDFQGGMQAMDTWKIDDSIIPPNEVELIFDKPAFARGRNGGFMAPKLSIARFSSLNHISLSPITQKEKIGSAEICIPWNSCKNFITEFAKVSNIAIIIQPDTHD